ncbi:cytochrome P450, partial [Tuber brumale]
KQYGKYGKSFRVMTPARDIILLSNQEALQELIDLPDSVTSSRQAGDEMLGTTYTFHEGMIQDAYHVDLIRKNMTEKLLNILPDIVDEIKVASEELIDVKDDWTNINVSNISSGIISRYIITRLILVGLPLCQNQEYLNNISRFSLNVIKGAMAIETVPWFLRWTIVRFFLNKNGVQDLVVKHVGGVFEGRQKLKISGTSSPTPQSDAIQWILDAAPPGTPILKLVQRLMFFNFASIHSMSIILAHFLYDLAANPEFQDPVCAEIEEVLISEGSWTKQALTKMKKLDSLFRESARMNTPSILSPIRKVLIPHTFSDGTYVPKGVWVCGSPHIVHNLSALYANPEVFDGFRFYRMRQLEGRAHHYQMSSPALDYLPFGTGKNSCPGRFFASNQLKIAAAYILYNYKLRLNGGASGKKPSNVCMGITCIPNPTAGIELMKRERSEKSLLFH